MKKKIQKLSLNKATIANLHDESLSKIRAGENKERCALSAVEQSCPVTYFPCTLLETCTVTEPPMCYTGVNDCQTN